MKPLCVDLFVGMFGFSAGWLELGGRVVGFDLEHLPHHGPVPDGAELVLQDVMTLRGEQFKTASLLLASPPCPEYSWMAMPWRRAKQAAAALRGDGEFPSGYRGSRTIAELTALFDCCFRLQREASEAAGHHIPLIVENVKGAQPWVGRAKARFGSFYLWGDVEDVGGRIMASGRPVFGAETVQATRSQKFNPDGTDNGQGSWFAVADSKNRGVQKRPGRNFHAFENGLGSSPTFNGAEHETRHVRVPGLPHGTFLGGGLAQGAIDGIKNSGGSWFAIGSPGQKELGQNPVTGGGVKQPGHSGRGWLADPDVAGHLSSRSSARKAASAQIARIPIELSRHIARCFWPGDAS